MHTASREPGALCRSVGWRLACGQVWGSEGASIDIFVRKSQHQHVPTPSASEVTPAPARREPFADSPVIGPRGLRTHQRILDAALEAFGESGYDRTTLDRIAELAGCSRVTIYQYVSGKDELFRRLATQAADQMWAAFEALEDVTPDRAATPACWRASPASPTSRRATSRSSGRSRQRPRTTCPWRVERPPSSAEPSGVFEARIVGSDLPLRLLDPTVELLNTGRDQRAEPHVDPPRRRARALRPGTGRPGPGRRRAPSAVRPAARRERPSPAGRPAGTGPAPQPRGAGRSSTGPRELEADARPGKRALRAILGVANDLIADRGYRGLRIDDVVRAAKVSRGPSTRTSTTSRTSSGSSACGDPGRVRGRARPPRGADAVRVAALAAPLRRGEPHERSAGPRVDRSDRGTTASGPAAVIDWGRRQMAAMLRPRELGDVEVEAEILMAIVEVFGSRARTKAELDAGLT